MAAKPATRAAPAATATPQCAGSRCTIATPFGEVTATAQSNGNAASSIAPCAVPCRQCSVQRVRPVARAVWTSASDLPYRVNCRATAGSPWLPLASTYPDTAFVHRTAPQYMKFDILPRTPPCPPFAIATHENRFRPPISPRAPRHGPLAPRLSHLSAKSRSGYARFQIRSAKCEIRNNVRFVPRNKVPWPRLGPVLPRCLRACPHLPRAAEPRAPGDAGGNSL